VAVPVVVYLEPTDRTDWQVERLIALVYLAIGLFVLLRRWTAPKSTHFFVFCLVSFIFYAFKFTGILDGLDITILTGNIIATELQPALFLHFAISFTQEGSRRRRLLYPLIYVPGLVLGILRYLSYTYWESTGALQQRLDKFDYAYLASFYILAAIVFWVRYRAEEQPLQRQQLKWLSRGTVLTVVPFTALYVIPFLFDAYMPSVADEGCAAVADPAAADVQLGDCALRLMDVDLIFKRGASYTLATAALVGMYFGVVALSAEMVHTRFQHLGEWGLVATVIVTGLVVRSAEAGDPGTVGRVFDQKSIDYRETLVEFGSELNAQTDLRALVNSIVERLPETLLVTRVAVFLAQEETAGKSKFSLAASHGLSQQVLSNADSLELGFLDFDNRDSSSHLFFETPNAMLRLPDEERQTAAALDLNYYVPCRAARHEGTGRSTIAVLGLGRRGMGIFFRARIWRCWSRWRDISGSRFRTRSCIAGWSRRFRTSSGCGTSTKTLWSRSTLGCSLSTWKTGSRAGMRRWK
jgi:two-component system NtrC family sensor kinase